MIQEEKSDVSRKSLSLFFQRALSVKENIFAEITSQNQRIEQSFPLLKYFQGIV
jgi:hypothetical protein